MGACFEALDEGVLMVPLNPMYTQVGFNSISVQVYSIKKKQCIYYRKWNVVVFKFDFGKRHVVCYHLSQLEENFLCEKKYYLEGGQ